MAFSWSTFKTRTLTAVIFAAVMLFGLLWNRWSFFLLFSVIHFGCWWEYLKLTEKIHKCVFHIYMKMGFMVMGYGLLLWFCGPNYRINGYGLKENFSLPVSAAGFALLLLGVFQKNTATVKSFAMALAGLVYISLCWGLMVDMFSSTRVVDLHLNDTVIYPTTSFFPLIIVISIWINDTMAYIVGSLIGKTPLSAISPKKTWEGTIGGIVLASVITGFLTPQLFISTVSFVFGLMLFIVALISAISGTIGDLFESKLKRMAGVKDSGSIMPGHGGFLDRFDSMLFAIPAVWIYLNL